MRHTYQGRNHSRLDPSWEKYLPRIESQLAGPEAEEYRLLIKRGAGWLEDQGVTDWPRVLVEAIENTDFGLNDPCHCAVGTCLGSFWDYFDLGFTDIAKAQSLGFWSPGEDAASWAALEQSWVDYAYERLEADR